jgi:proteasome lid subunit RPN8/RPN11
MAIWIPKSVLDEIHAHAEETYPEECCGILVADGAKRVTDSVRMKNVYSGPKNDRYNIDPLELYRADRTISQKGLGIAGVYHSHPDYPASLSQFDLEHSFPWYSYVVISVPKGKAQDTRSWIAAEDHKSVSEEAIEVVTEGER